MLMYENKVLYCILLYCVYSKFIEYFPDYLSALSRALLRFFWTTFVETAVFYTLVFRELGLCQSRIQKQTKSDCQGSLY